MRQVTSAMLIAFAVAMFVMSGAKLHAGSLDRPGWKVFASPYSFAALNARLDAAVGAHNLAVVTTASASEGAKAQGITIAGIRVIGVFRNDFARRMLALSIAAGIEAPLRLYVTENRDGTATLAYKPASIVFAPYHDEGEAALDEMAAELDGLLDMIAADAVGDGPGPK